MTSKDPLPGGRFIPIGDEIFLGVRDTPSSQEHASEDPESVNNFQLVQQIDWCTFSVIIIFGWSEFIVYVNL